MNLPVAFVEKMKVLLGEEFDQYIKCYEENRLYGKRVDSEPQKKRQKQRER